MTIRCDPIRIGLSCWLLIKPRWSVIFWRSFETQKRSLRKFKNSVYGILFARIFQKYAFPILECFYVKNINANSIQDNLYYKLGWMKFLWILKLTRNWNLAAMLRNWNNKACFLKSASFRGKAFYITFCDNKSVNFLARVNPFSKVKPSVVA